MTDDDALGFIRIALETEAKRENMAKSRLIENGARMSGGHLIEEQATVGATVGKADGTCNAASVSSKSCLAASTCPSFAK